MRGVVQCNAGGMLAHEQSYRLYNCGRCAEQVRICRGCDRGNQYCAGVCAGLRRRESLRRAGERYQRSYRGACAHAARQRAWRKRQTQEVTHQGSIPTVVWVTVVSRSTQTTPQGTHAHNQPLPQPPAGVLELAALPVHARCSVCGRVLSPFGRLGRLRGEP
jgi:hypothetical protein